MRKGWIVGLAMLAATMAEAQEAGSVWVQVEALPTLGRAQARVEDYAGTLPDVQGYYLGSGWYGVVLGPYAPDEAAAVRQRLLDQGIIPGDAFLADGTAFRQQFYPLGEATEAAATEPVAGAGPVAVAQTAADTGAAPAPAAPALPDETPEEAMASEALLTQGEKELLQTALAWAGVYAGGIDGAFGRGTRAAMAAWQQAQGHEATGILTSRERAELLAAYNAPLEGLGMETVRDEATGIEVVLPMAALTGPVYEPPFARFDPEGGSGVRVVLISQPGDQGRLAGLYEIMQTLEIVPPEGPRERGAEAFAIEGIDAEVHSTTYAWLVDGTIKGFTLVWPAGDEERRARVLDLMLASFRRLPGVLDPGAGEASEEQGVDLISGLEVRQPRATASGFFVDGLGTVVTAAAAVEGCERVTLDEAHGARVAALDEGLGLAILEPEEPLAPRAVASFQTAVPRIATEVAVAGYPYGGALAQPALTFGSLADIRGLNGEEEVKRLELAARPGDAGGAVLDAGGAVLGMLLPHATGGQVLPPDVQYALESEAILAALGRAGIDAATTDTVGAVPPQRLAREAAGIAVLVSCW